MKGPTASVSLRREYVNAQKFGVALYFVSVSMFQSGTIADASPAQKNGAFNLREWRLKHPHRFEVSKKKQRIFEYRPGRSKPIVYRTSTGSGEMYWHRRKRRMVRAVTPSGLYVVALKRPGWVKSRTVSGAMYFPMFLRPVGSQRVTGMDLHGSKQYHIPRDSHGCLRFFWGRARAVSRRTPVGTQVLIY